MDETRFIAIYRWRVRPGLDEQFRSAWLQLTHSIRSYRGSHGSRLTRDAAGTYVAIAFWPSREAWAATEPAFPDEEVLLAQLRSAVSEAFPAELLNVEIDGSSMPAPH